MLVTLEGRMSKDPPVPTGLATIRSFINTGAYDPVVEELTTPAVLTAWLTEHDLAPADEERPDADLARAIRVREALRAFAAGNAGEPVPDDALAVPHEQRRRSKLRVTSGRY